MESSSKDREGPCALDTQLSRLGGPNFHEIPINRAVCPMHNFQRDGHMRTTVPTGRVNYEPTRWAPSRRAPTRARASRRTRRPTAARSCASARNPSPITTARRDCFFISQTEPEQDHIVSALIFELSKVETPAIRERVVSHLVHVDQRLAERVAAGLGLGKIRPATPATPVKAPAKPSPALSIIRKAEKTIKGRVIGCLAPMAT